MPLLAPGPQIGTPASCHEYLFCCRSTYSSACKPFAGGVAAVGTQESSGKRKCYRRRNVRACGTNIGVSTRDIRDALVIGMSNIRKGSMSGCYTQRESYQSTHTNPVARSAQCHLRLIRKPDKRATSSVPKENETRGLLCHGHRV